MMKPRKNAKPRRDKQKPAENDQADKRLSLLLLFRRQALLLSIQRVRRFLGQLLALPIRNFPDPPRHAERGQCFAKLPHD